MCDASVKGKIRNVVDTCDPDPLVQSSFKIGGDPSSLSMSGQSDWLTIVNHNNGSFTLEAERAMANNSRNLNITVTDSGVEKVYEIDWKMKGEAIGWGAPGCPPTFAADIGEMEVRDVILAEVKNSSLNQTRFTSRVASNDDGNATVVNMTFSYSTGSAAFMNAT